jgi:hypothetical protein
MAATATATAAVAVVTAEKAASKLSLYQGNLVLHLLQESFLEGSHDWIYSVCASSVHDPLLLS